MSSCECPLVKQASLADFTMPFETIIARYRKNGLFFISLTVLSDWIRRSNSDNTTPDAFNRVKADATSSIMVEELFGRSWSEMLSITARPCNINPVMWQRGRLKFDRSLLLMLGPLGNPNFAWSIESIIKDNSWPLLLDRPREAQYSSLSRYCCRKCAVYAWSCRFLAARWWFKLLIRWRWRTHWEHTECIVFGRNFRCGKSSYQTCLKQAKTIKLCSGLVLQPKMKRLGTTHKNYNCKEQVTFQKYEKLTLCSSSLALSWSK